MKPVLIVFSLLLSFTAKGHEINCSVKKILEQQYGVNTFFISSYQVAFRMDFIEEEVLRKQYIKGFYYRKSELAAKHRQLIARVEDSIANVNKQLRNKCAPDIDSIAAWEPEMKAAGVQYAVFLSPVCNGTLYAEVVEARYVLLLQNRYQYTGPVQQHFFVFGEDGLVKQHYKGRQHRD